MTCPKCGSSNVDVQLVQDSAVTRTKKTGCLWRLGRLLLIVCTLGLWLIIGKRKSKSKTTYSTSKVAVCKQCGHSWNI